MIGLSPATNDGHTAAVSADAQDKSDGARTFGAALEALFAGRPRDAGAQKTSKDSQLDPSVFHDLRLTAKRGASELQNVQCKIEMARLSEGNALTAVGDASPSFFDDMLKSILAGQGDMATYSKIVEALTDLYKKIAEVMKAAADATSSVDDGKKTKVDEQAIAKKMEELFGGNTSGLNDQDLKVAIPDSEINMWKSELGGDLFTFNKNNDGSWDVSLSMNNGGAGKNPLQLMYDQLHWNDDVEMDNAAYQKWDLAFTTEKDNFQNDVQTMVQKYSHQNSNYDNMVKVESGSIDEFTNLAKGFLSF
ncbi:IpaD/SipD/SspD family type III secretion system needle tip protein [Burkholderia pyrrocinia]